jgi:hypothetical protein
MAFPACIQLLPERHPRINPNIQISRSNLSHPKAGKWKGIQERREDGDGEVCMRGMRRFLQLPWSAGNSISINPPKGLDQAIAPAHPITNPKTPPRHRASARGSRIRMGRTPAEMAPTSPLGYVSTITTRLHDPVLRVPIPLRILAIPRPIATPTPSLLRHGPFRISSSSAQKRTRTQRSGTRTRTR